MFSLDDYSNEMPRSELSRKRTRSTILFIAAMVVAAFCIGFLFDLGPEPPVENVLSNVGDFPADHIWFNTSEPLSLYNQLSRHVVVVFFCRLSTLSDLQYLSRLEDIQIEFQEEPLVVVACIQMESDSINELRNIIDDWGIEFPVIIDDHGTVSHRFDVSTFPSLVVLDSRARVSARFYVGWEKADLRGIVDDLLQQLRAMRYSQFTSFKPDGGCFIPSPTED
jgi:peroxiredoxin